MVDSDKPHGTCEKGFGRRNRIESRSVMLQDTFARPREPAIIGKVAAPIRRAMISPATPQCMTHNDGTPTMCEVRRMPSTEYRHDARRRGVQTETELNNAPVRHQWCVRQDLVERGGSQSAGVEVRAPDVRFLLSRGIPGKFRACPGQTSLLDPWASDVLL